jgi:predicted ABC-type ATPase
MKRKLRLRIFAGPNGSGKSTIIDIIRKQGIDLGIYVNADEIKKELDVQGCLSFDRFGLTVHGNQFKGEFEASSFFEEALCGNILSDICVENNCLIAKNSDMNDYMATFTADFIRRNLLKNSIKFSFETVMSHPSKLDLIAEAHQMGYKTYLYFVSLEDPILNQERVKSRVMLKGHDVPMEKIVLRYYRTMNLLLDAIKSVDKAFFFDNSKSQPALFAKYENNHIDIISQEMIPRWFYEYVLDKL